MVKCNNVIIIRSSDFLLFAKNGLVVGVRSLKVTARAGCCYECTPLSQCHASLVATQYSAACQTHTVHIELDGARQAGRQAGRQARQAGRQSLRRMEDRREGARGGWEQGNGREGGREGGREVESDEGREGGSDDDRQGERVSGGREGRGREGC